jgi:hypothetical protein
MFHPEMMRQIIGVFDEYTSRENGKNVTRAMRESARQGFWNGARPPLGYRIVEAERRGSKIKKRLEVDPIEAELVRLIFKLYSEGDGISGPLGVKDTTKWLNGHGYRTRRGSSFGVGPLPGLRRRSGTSVSSAIISKLPNLRLTQYQSCSAWALIRCRLA